MLDLDGCEPCPRWCSHLYCANEAPADERWHRSSIWSVPTTLAGRLAGTGAVQTAQIYLSQGVRELEPTLNVDQGIEVLLRLRPPEARQFAQFLHVLLEQLEGSKQSYGN